MQDVDAGVVGYNFIFHHILTILVSIVDRYHV